MQSGASPYEVRCPRCDVSFPIGTRRCVHCGGPTAAPGAAPSLESGPFERTQPEPVQIGEEEAPGVGSSLLKLSGSLFWIVALVIFSLVRHCGEG
ncbi:MAG: hypothetical protein R3F35_23000 [Myxococcota bacterium]